MSFSQYNLLIFSPNSTIFLIFLRSSNESKSISLRSKSLKNTRSKRKTSFSIRRDSSSEMAEGGRKIYIGNLTTKAQERDLEEAFCKFGEIEDVYIPRDRNTWEGRGFAFITFSTKEAAKEASEDWNDRRFLGKRIAVNIARPRPPARDGRGLAGGVPRTYVPSRDGHREYYDRRSYSIGNFEKFSYSREDSPSYRRRSYSRNRKSYSRMD